MWMKCQPDGADRTAARPSKVSTSLVEEDSEPTGNAEFSGHINSRCVPFAALLNQQRRAAVTAGSSAIAPQQHSAGGICRAPNDTALGIGHQNQRMILLIAAEHDGAPDLRQFADHRQDAIRQA